MPLKVTEQLSCLILGFCKELNFSKVSAYFWTENISDDSQGQVLACVQHSLNYPLKELHQIMMMR